MLLSTSEPVSIESNNNPNLFRRVLNFFGENPEYVTAVIYFCSNLVELITKSYIKRLSGGSEKEAVFFLFSLIGFFFLNVAQSGIGLFSKKILQLRNQNREYHIGPLLIRLYMFNIFSCALIFSLFLGINSFFYGRPEGVVSILLDMPAEGRNVRIVDTLPWGTVYGCSPMLFLLFLQQITKSLYQPLLAIIGTYRRVFWFGMEKVGASISRLTLVFIIFRLASFEPSTRIAVNAFIYFLSYFFVFCVSLFGVWDIISGWMIMAREYRNSVEHNRELEENGRGFSIRALDPYIITSFLSQCGFTLLKTLTYIFIELFSFLKGFYALTALSSILHPLSDIIVGLGYIITPRLLISRNNREAVVPTFIRRIIGTFMVLIFLLALDWIISFTGYSYVLYCIHSSSISYLFAIAIIFMSIFRGISFLLPSFGLVSRAPVLMINYICTFAGFGYLMWNNQICTEVMITITILTSLIVNIALTLLVVHYYDCVDRHQQTSSESSSSRRSSQ